VNKKELVKATAKKLELPVVETERILTRLLIQLLRVKRRENLIHAWFVQHDHKRETRTQRH